MRLLLGSDVVAATIILEAGNQPDDGMTGVAEVIRNRTKMKYSSDGTIHDTCFHPGQFSCWSGDNWQNIRELFRYELNLLKWQAAMEAWERAQKGSNLTDGAVHYYNPKLVPHQPSWVPHVVKTVEIGDHVFFKLP